MKRNFIAIMLVSLGAFSNANADNTIFKCVEADGSVTYLNTSARQGNCTKTDLANPEKVSIVSSNDRLERKISIPGAKISSQKLDDTSAEQFLRDSKRVLILQKELQQEQEQLNTINNMIKNANGDPEQAKQLAEMQNTHKGNIAALEKELGANKLSIKPNNVSSANDEPKLIVVNPKKQNIKSGSLPVNVLNTNPDISKINHVDLPLEMPTSIKVTKELSEKSMVTSSAVSLLETNKIPSNMLSENAQTLEKVKTLGTYITPFAKEASLIINKFASN